MTRAELIEAMARAYDREDAAQMGEPSPWSIADRDPDWESGRLACAEAALSAIEQAGMVVVPVEPTGEMKTAGHVNMIRAEPGFYFDGPMASICYRAMIESGRLK